MTYSLDALGDFMQVGPQVYPERPGGVQVIMRGPHGRRFAADQVRSREGSARGSGFRTWVEQLNVPQNVKWQPENKVVGLLGGLYDDFTDWAAGKIADTGVLDARGGNTGGKKFDSSANQTVGTLTPVDKAMRTQAVLAFDQEVDRAPARYTADQFRSHVARLRDMLVSSRWTDSGSSPRYLPQPKLLEILSSAQNRVIQRSGVREDGAPMISPTAVDERGRERRNDPREAARRSLRDDLDRAGRSGMSMFTKALLLGGAGLAVYAIASGYGKGLATRGRKGA